MTGTEENAEKMKDDITVAYMKEREITEEKEREEVGLTGGNELDTAKCSKEDDFDVSLGREKRREKEKEEDGGEKRSQVLRLEALLMKFQDAWRRLPNLWREIHVVYECEGVFVSLFLL